MKPGVALLIFAITTLRVLPSEAGEVAPSYGDGGVMGASRDAHDPSARFAGTSPSREPRRGGTLNVQIAQGGRDGRDDGAGARSDALMGTPNKKTPVPQNNVFSTSPRLEQQPPAIEPPAPRGATPAPPR